MGGYGPWRGGRDGVVTKGEMWLKVIDVEGTLEALQTMPDELAGAARKVVGLETKISKLKRDILAQSQEEYEMAVVEATMEAYASDEIDGKNQKTRDVQLAMWLGTKSRLIVSTKAQLRSIESEVAAQNAALEVARGEYKAIWHGFQAALASAKLKTAMLNAYELFIESEKGE